MGRFQLESFYLYFPTSSQLLYSILMEIHHILLSNLCNLQPHPPSITFCHPPNLCHHLVRRSIPSRGSTAKPAPYIPMPCSSLARSPTSPIPSKLTCSSSNLISSYLHPVGYLPCLSTRVNDHQFSTITLFWLPFTPNLTNFL